MVVWPPVGTRGSRRKLLTRHGRYRQISKDPRTADQLSRVKLSWLLKSLAKYDSVDEIVSWWANAVVLWQSKGFSFDQREMRQSVEMEEICEFESIVRDFDKSLHAVQVQDHDQFPTYLSSG